jgi:excinuclease ABC subunit C
MADLNQALELKLKSLPDKPGVYQYFDSGGKLIYVGKAKNLKKRVGSYFTKTPENAKTAILIRQISDLQYIVVNTEQDALLLENNLIKEHQPKYNIQLKDDKTYPWICIKNEAFPRVFSTRKIIDDGSKYFGPYTSGKVMHAMLELIKELYPLRTCQLVLSEKNIADKKFNVCLEYHIGNCLAPCIGNHTVEEYQEQINQIETLLRGNTSGVLLSLRQNMNHFAAAHQYEQAHVYKNKIMLLEKYQSKSTIVSPTINDVDVCTLIEDQQSAFVNYLIIHKGAIIQAYTSEISKKLDEKRDEILSYVIPQLRNRFRSSSKTLLLDSPVDFSINGLYIIVPSRGEKKQLIDLSLRNAHYYKIEKQKKEKITHPEKHEQRLLEQIKNDFRLKELPIHIECFDNSNIQGSSPVAACVVFKNGKPSKKDYRHFNVKTVVGADDFATMEEIVYRRYKRILEEKSDLPQLIVIDGGKGQLGAAGNALKKLDLFGRVGLISIAKRLEEIYFPGDSLPMHIDKRSESLKVIQHMRNEAHRFGIGFHRKKRDKATISSELTNLPGIGIKTQVLLMQHFKTISAIKKASIEELTTIMGNKKSLKIFNLLHKKA